MSGLVAYLDNACVEIVSMSARTIWFLSQSPSNRPLLMAQPGLFEKLVRAASYWVPFCSIPNEYGTKSTLTACMRCACAVQTEFVAA
jgi:hypothetical protein